MLLRKERQLITEYGQKLVEKKLTKGTGGNLSIYNRERNLMVISPSGIAYDELKLDDIVVMNLSGEVIEGVNKPSSEYELHKILYEKRGDLKAVIHTHPTYSTTISCLRKEIPAVHYLVAVGGQKIPCASYATFGSKKLAKNVYKAMGNKYKASLMANHGLIAAGKDIKEAFNISELVEFTAELFYRTSNIGDPKILSKKEIKRVVKKFEQYGQD